MVEQGRDGFYERPRCPGPCGPASGGQQSPNRGGLCQLRGPLADAPRIARADRLRRIRDPDGTGVPAVGLANPAFADERRRLIGGPAPDSLAAGNP